MARPKVTKELRLIPVDLINDPKFLMRENLGTDEELLELGKSLEVRQIEAIVVFKVDDRFDLVAGHRRVYAARLCKIPALWAEIVEGDLESLAMMRFQENKQRLQASPYEEAVFLAEMWENFKCTQVELANKLSMSAAYVAQRLAILKGYPGVREALRCRVINFAQCRELMQFPSEKSAMEYLAITVQSGATSDLLRRWRAEQEMAFKEIESGGISEEDARQQRTLVQLQLRSCEVCGQVVDPTDLQYLKVCHTCGKTLIKSVEKFRQ